MSPTQGGIILQRLSSTAKANPLIKDTFEQQTFYGPVKPEQLGRALVAEFNHGNFRARMLGRGKQRVVQIATRKAPRSGGRTAITVHLVEHDDGIHVRIGQQDWLGVAASLGWTALAALRQPMSLLGRLDDLAQDLASLQLTARIWQTLSAATESLGLSHELSERLRSLSCAYCGTANPVGEPHCVACGAPMGDLQPRACPTCGYLVDSDLRDCPQCGGALT